MNFTALEQKLDTLCRCYPFLRHDIIGTSVQGRPLYSVSLGNTQQLTLMAGAFHAQEWLTTALLMRYLEEVSASMAGSHSAAFDGIDTALEQRGLMVVPMVNPDGVEIALNGTTDTNIQAIAARSTESWQANANGVDLNHNFDAGFELARAYEEDEGITGPAPRRYGGTHPHSEPESAAMVRLLEDWNIQRLYAFHSQGEEIFYSYGEHTPPTSRSIAEAISQHSGYRMVENTGSFSHAGYKDCFIEHYHRPGFTIEIGKGVNPLPVEQLGNIYTKLRYAMGLMATI